VFLESNPTRLSALFVTCSRKYVMGSADFVCKLLCQILIVTFLIFVPTFFFKCDLLRLKFLQVHVGYTNCSDNQFTTVFLDAFRVGVVWYIHKGYSSEKEIQCKKHCGWSPRYRDLRLIGNFRFRGLAASCIGATSINDRVKLRNKPTLHILWWFIDNISYVTGDRGGTVVKVLCYESEGRWFDSSWCYWNFSLI